MRPATILRLCAATLALVSALFAVHPPTADAAGYTKINGSGSTWSFNALDQWRRNIAANLGMTVNFAANGSSQGREQFKNNVVDFAVSEIPYGLTEAGVRDAPPKRGYAYMPIVGGGTAFMYNLRIGGKLVTNLRLSGPVIAKIFTGKITRWNDRAISADNPGLSLPARTIVPVVRSDGSGTTAQFTTWLAKEQSGLWNDYCKRTGRSGTCGMTSYYPTLNGSSMIAKSGSLGVSGFVRRPGSGEGSITYVEYSYAIKTGYPVAKMLNRADYYVEPTASSVAVALLKAEIDENKDSPDYLTQILDKVYRDADRRTYPLSSYSYMILPTKQEAGFTADKGRSLGTFANYFLCDGQQQGAELGYSPLPKNLVQAGFNQVRRIPGSPTSAVDIDKCRNPTFSPDGTNTLAKNAPYPKACDHRGPTQCSTGTGGAHGSTPVKQGAGGSGGGGNGSGGGKDDKAGPAAGGKDSGSATSGGAGAGAGSGGGADPDTGELISGDGSGGEAGVAGSPVTLAAGSDLGPRGALMGLSAALLVALVVGPPVTARMLAARARRGEESA